MDSHSRAHLRGNPFCAGIVPPYLLQHLAVSGDSDVAERARRTLVHDSHLRARPGRPSALPTAVAPEHGPARTVHDAHGTTALPGDVVRREGGNPAPDYAVNQAYDGLGETWRLYDEAFARNSIDGHGLPLLATVHYDQRYDNAFWDGSQMVFGDGDGTIFLGFTRSLDVIGHELTHGVTQSTAGLDYNGQPGALNESISDVFGSLVKQHALGQSADQADWLIGADLLASGVAGVALRSMKAPGTAYDDPRLGKDPQPADMAGYVETSDDNGGVHINSGIPNRAFQLAASAIGGSAWDAPGRIWYSVLTGSGIRPDCDFATFAGLTVEAAAERFGAGSAEAKAVEDAWRTVGVLEVRAPASLSTRSEGDFPGSPFETTSDELSLRRTGGFAGMVHERTLRLAELPDEDAARWRDLLADDRLVRLAAAPTHPDAFCYGVRCDAARVDVTIPEPALESDVKELFERTLTR